MTTEEQVKEWQSAAKEGTIKDELNPILSLNSTATELLVRIANGEIGAVELAKHHLRNRGLDDNEKWVGFGRKIALRS